MAVACAAVALFAAPRTGAQTTPPPAGSGVEQYRELVPGAGGPSAPGVEKSDQAPLTPVGMNALEKESPELAKALEEIATSSDYGAPNAPAKPATATREADVVSPDASVDAAFDGTVSAIGSASDARMLGLLVAVLGTTVAAVALALRRRAIQ
jgi:hypothetical protein